MNNIKASLIVMLLGCMSSITTYAQSVGIHTATPDATAALDIVSTSKGLLIPRMNSAQRTGIVSPAVGLLVFDTEYPPEQLHLA